MYVNADDVSKTLRRRRRPVKSDDEVSGTRRRWINAFRPEDVLTRATRVFVRTAAARVNRKPVRDDRGDYENDKILLRTDNKIYFGIAN